MLRLPGIAGGTKRHHDASGSSSPPSKRPRESSAWADEEVPRKIAPRVRVTETDSPPSSPRLSLEPGPSSPRFALESRLSSFPDAVASSPCPQTLGGRSVPDLGLHTVGATPARQSTAQPPARSSTLGTDVGAPPTLDLPAPARTGLHTPPSSRSIAISLFGAENEDASHERQERPASLVYLTESADDERFMSAEEGPMTDVDEATLGSARPASVAEPAIAAGAPTATPPSRPQRLIGLGLVASVSLTPASSSIPASPKATSREPNGSIAITQSPVSDVVDSAMVDLSTDSELRGFSRVKPTASRPGQVQQQVARDAVPLPIANVIGTAGPSLPAPAVVAPLKKRKPARPKTQLAAGTGAPGETVAPPSSTDPVKRKPGRPEKHPLPAATSTASLKTGNGRAAQPPLSQPLIDHQAPPRITVGAQSIHLDRDPSTNTGPSRAQPRSPPGHGWDSRLERDVALAISARVEKRFHIAYEERERLARENSRLTARLAKLKAASQLHPLPSDGQLPTPGTDTPLGNNVAPVSPTPPSSPPFRDVAFPALELEVGPLVPLDNQQAPTSSERGASQPSPPEAGRPGKWDSTLQRGSGTPGPCLAKHERLAREDLSRINLGILASASVAIREGVHGEAAEGGSSGYRSLPRRFEPDGEPAEDEVDPAHYTKLVLELDSMRKELENAIDPAAHDRVLAENEALRRSQEDRVDAHVHGQVRADARAASKAKAKLERRLTDTAAELAEVRTALDAGAAKFEAQRLALEEANTSLASKLRRSNERVKALEGERAHDREALREAQKRLAEERGRDRSSGQTQVNALKHKIERLEADNKELQALRKTTASENRDKLNEAGILVHKKDQQISALKVRLKELQEQEQREQERQQTQQQRDDDVKAQLYAKFEQKQDHIHALEVDNSRFREDAVASNEKLARLQTENDDLKTQNDRLMAELRTKRSIGGDLKSDTGGAGVFRAEPERMRARNVHEASVAAQRPVAFAPPTPATPATPSFSASHTPRPSTGGSQMPPRQTLSTVGGAPRMAARQHSQTTQGLDQLPPTPTSGTERRDPQQPRPVAVAIARPIPSESRPVAAAIPNVRKDDSWQPPNRSVQSSVRATPGHGETVGPPPSIRPELDSTTSTEHGRDRDPRHRNRPKGARPGHNRDGWPDRPEASHVAQPMRMASRDVRDERRGRDEQGWRDREPAYWPDERRGQRDWRSERRGGPDPHRWEPRRDSRDGHRRGSPEYSGIGYERAEWHSGGWRR